MIEVNTKLDIDKYNYKLYHNGYNNTDKMFICRQCGEKVNLDDSYSNEGKNLHCISCIRKNSRLLDITVAEYGKKYIWN